MLIFGQQPTTGETTREIRDTYDGDFIGMGQSVVVKGTVTKGIIVLGGDCIVEGRVEGDVATIGGTVYQRPNSFIGGDVIAIGGGYNHGKTAPGRNPNSQTVMYAGYETELREAMQNPAALVLPEFTAAYFVQRVLAAVFWFVLSLILTTVTPGAVSRAVSRLRLTGLRVAVIGSVAMVILTLGITSGVYLPTILGVAIVLLTSVLLFLAFVFGRVTVQAATGKWLQKRIFGENHRSETTALLLGATAWTFILSLPYLWTIAFVGLIIVSLGIVLTARPSLGWKQS